MSKGLKIELEGTDGAGKTTALKYLIEKLQGSGSTVLETREVGSPLVPINVKLRELVLDPDSGLSGEAMEFIFAAMRIENDKVYNRIGQEFDFIVSDRGWLSHLAYTDHNVNEAFTEGLYLDFVGKVTELPDVVIYLDVDTTTALRRRVSRGEGMDVIEAKGVGFQDKVRGSFKKYIGGLGEYSNKTRFFAVNANLDVEGVQRQIDDIVLELTGSNNES